MQSLHQWDPKSSRYHLHLLENSPAGGRLLWQQPDWAALVHLWTGGKCDLFILLLVHLHEPRAATSNGNVEIEALETVVCHLLSSLQMVLLIHIVSLQPQAPANVSKVEPYGFIFKREAVQGKGFRMDLTPFCVRNHICRLGRTAVWFEWSFVKQQMISSFLKSSV